jgi:hypothetical protein
MMPCPSSPKRSWGQVFTGCCPNSKSPGANIKEFLVTILGEAKEEQFPLFEPTGRVWKLPEASLRMVKKSFQRAKGDLSNSPFTLDKSV